MPKIHSIEANKTNLSPAVRAKWQQLEADIAARRAAARAKLKELRNEQAR